MGGYQEAFNHMGEMQIFSLNLVLISMLFECIQALEVYLGMS